MLMSPHFVIKGGIIILLKYTRGIFGINCIYHRTLLRHRRNGEREGWVNYNSKSCWNNLTSYHYFSSNRH